MQAVLQTAGERVEVTCANTWIARVLEEGAAGQLTPAGDARPDIRVTVDKTADPFDTMGWDVLTRDAWRRPGQVVVRNACSSGLDLSVTATKPTLQVIARWRPPFSVRGASMLLRARSQLLIRAVLLQYPALWWSQQRGRAPLHASICTVGAADPRTVLIAGPGGVGKSTIVNAELARGAQSASDNLCVSDGHTSWGLVEPRRVPAGDPGAGNGRRMPHGRREAPWPNRVEEVIPDILLVLRRGSAKTTAVEPCGSDEAARFLTAGTYMAGELRRYWAFAATLALGTGLGDVLPPIESVAQALSTGMPCLQVVLGERRGTPLCDLLPAERLRK